MTGERGSQRTVGPACPPGFPQFAVRHKRILRRRGSLRYAQVRDQDTKSRGRRAFPRSAPSGVNGRYGKAVHAIGQYVSPG